MTTAIDNFTKNLYDNLEAVEERVKSLRESIQSAPKKTQIEIESQIDEAKTKLDAKKDVLDLSLSGVGSFKGEEFKTLRLNLIFIP
jgi:hypothetical protein